MKALGKLSRLWLPLCAYVIVGSSQSFADMRQDFMDYFIGPLEVNKTPVFLAECSHEQLGKVAIIFPIGERKGRLLAAGTVDANGKTLWRINQGIVSVGNEAIIEDLLHGGPGSTEYARQIVEYLLRTKFKMVLPKDLASILESVPETVCPRWQ